MELTCLASLYSVMAVLPVLACEELELLGLLSVHSRIPVRHSVFNNMNSIPISLEGTVLINRTDRLLT